MAGDMYLENLEEFVFDEDRVVTYRWLSQTLSVHVNQAKQMLETFVQSQQRKASAPSVSVTYLLSGVQKTDNGVSVNKILVVADKDLENTEATLAQVLSKHVYSVQKALLKDSNSLYATDYQIIKENIRQPNKFSAIQCAEAKPRSAQELADLGERAAYPTSDTSGQRQPRINGNAEKHVIESLKPGPQRGAAGRAKKGQITSFGGFAAGSNKGTTDGPERKEQAEPSRVKKEDKKQSSSKPKSGMMAFLNRPSTTKPKRDNKSPPRETKPTTMTMTTRKSPPREVATASSKQDRKQEVEKNLKAGGKAKRKAAKIEVSDSDSEDERQTTKRRRRIIQQDVSSSSSEDELSDMEDSPIPPTPPPAPVDVNSSDNEEGSTNGSSHPPSKKESTTTSPSSGKRRRKKRVLRNKTTIDEDGCMVTEKVYESDWMDVSEDEAPPPKKTTPAPSQPSPKESGAKTGGEEEGGKKKNKSSPGGKPKQRSLMSFFKKK